MASSFGDHLTLFALSVDVIGKNRLERAAKLIDDYVHRQREKRQVISKR